MRTPISTLLALALVIGGCTRSLQSTGDRQATPQADTNTAAALPPETQARARELVTSGEEKLLAGDYPGAVTDLTEALKADPANAQAHSHRGVARAKLEDFDGALADYTRALELDATLYIAHYNRGRIHARQEAYQDAIEDFTAAIDAKPDFARALSNRGFARAQLEDYEGAIQDLQAAKDIFLEEGDSFGYHRVSNAIRYMLP